MNRLFARIVALVMAIVFGYIIAVGLVKSSVAITEGWVVAGGLVVAVIFMLAIVVAITIMYLVRDVKE